MATKKLSVEVDVDTAEAKKKLQEMESSGGKSVAPKVENAADNAARVIDRLSASAQRCAEATDAETAKKKLQEIEDTGGNSAAQQVENSAERMARSMDKASAATERHAEAAEHSSGNLKQAAKAFAGMGVALATKYAEGQMEQGSPEQKAVGYIGGAVSGALAGSVAGPLGIIAGAVTAIATKFMSDKQAKQQAAEANLATNKTNRETFEEWARARAETLKFRDTLEALTNAETPLVERQKLIAEKIRELDAEEGRLRGGAKFNSSQFADKEDQKKFGENMRELQSVTQQRDQLASLAKALDKEAKREDKQKERGGSAADYSAMDALARIGGNFAGGESANTMRNLEQHSKDQLTVLREIRDKKTGGTF